MNHATIPARKSRQELEREDVITALKVALKKGTVVYTVLRHVSASGMSRSIDLYVIEGNRPIRLTWSIAIALRWSYDRRHEALKVEGAGMDMGFHAVYCLSALILGEGDALEQRWL